MSTPLTLFDRIIGTDDLENDQKLPINKMLAVVPGYMEGNTTRAEIMQIFDLTEAQMTELDEYVQHFQNKIGQRVGEYMADTTGIEISTDVAKDRADVSFRNLLLKAESKEWTEADARAALGMPPKTT
jgi:hypothetical protein